MSSFTLNGFETTKSIIFSFDILLEPFSPRKLADIIHNISKALIDLTLK